MENLWDDAEAKRLTGDSSGAARDLAFRVYTSRLLGQNDDLVLHGGGNTSVKSSMTNIFGESEEIQFVKGSGWDLRTIEPAGFSPARLDVLKRLGRLESMTDTDMARELKASMLDPGAPSPSVEAILHALIPFKYVDHTHADAVVAISNTDDGEKRLAEIFGDDVLILPYVMPGFVLAGQVHEATRSIDWSTLKGIILMHHGVFSFHAEAKGSYDAMIELVSRAEEYLASNGAVSAIARHDPEIRPQDYLHIARARRRVSEQAGCAMLAAWKTDEESVGYSMIDGIEDIATRGPITPDHTLHTKRVPAILQREPEEDIDRFVGDYRSYFDRHDDGTLTRLDPAPRFAVWKNHGCIVFGANAKRMSIVSDIADHTMKAVQWGEALGGWRALSESEIFEVEYWDLEQAKLKLAPSRREMEGKIALVTGAASGIGRASVEALAARGAAVVALDIDAAVSTCFEGNQAIRGVVCDVTDESAVQQAVFDLVAGFGGLDVVVSNAGSFPESAILEDLGDDLLETSMRLNFTSHVQLLRACIPFLKLGVDPAVVLIASKNVPAPGPGAGAYSAAKAALTQIGRVAALELGEHGIRVNTIHPNAVFDTGVWTDEILQQRAAHYGMSVEAYKKNNVLRTDVTSKDVAELVAAMAGPAFGKTTGAQVPVDGGNDRVI